MIGYSKRMLGRTTSPINETSIDVYTKPFKSYRPESQGASSDDYKGKRIMLNRYEDKIYMFRSSHTMDRTDRETNEGNSHIIFTQLQLTCNLAIEEIYNDLVNSRLVEDNEFVISDLNNGYKVACKVLKPKILPKSQGGTGKYNYFIVVTTVIDRKSEEDNHLKGIKKYFAKYNNGNSPEASQNGKKRRKRIPLYHQIWDTAVNGIAEGRRMAPFRRRHLL